MTYAEAIQFLYDLRLFGAKFGLENTVKFAALAGNPHHKLRFIHVAGTNGKGSTCAMLESIYRAMGLRVGLFTSPHLVSFAERIQVDRRCIREADVVRLVNELQTLCRGFHSGGTDSRSPTSGGPTFFEFVTIMAMRYFVEQNCDLVIWETGLGGRLDATNIVTPLAGVITNIGIEHSEWLGDTFDKIAAEKAGIIKPLVPVITAARPGEGLEVIESVARRLEAPITVVTPDNMGSLPIAPEELPLHGPHQRLNAATAMAVVKVLGGELGADPNMVREGLRRVDWPGRMQRVQTESGQVILLDGAHNPAGAEALRIALETEFPSTRPTMVIGVFRDKDSASMCRSLAPVAGRLLLTSVHSDRTEDPAKLANTCREANPHASVTVCASLPDAMSLAARDPFVVVAGSLYLVGEAMEWLHLSAATAADEKPLNEWRGR